jgi:hypothetical protein
MTQPVSSEDILTGIRLSEAVAKGDSATVRLISSEVDSEFIQKNANQVFMHTFVLLNSISGERFPDDVWEQLPKFLNSDVKDRAIILGCSEDLLHGMVGGFLTHNIIPSLNDETSKYFNPDGYSAGYFQIAAAMGEAILGLFKVAAKLRFEDDYKQLRSLVTDHMLITSAIAEDDAQAKAS